MGVSKFLGRCLDVFRKGFAMSNVARYGLVLLLLAVFASTGCAVFTRSAGSTVFLNYPHATEATLGQTPSEHFRVASDVARRDGLALIEDLDLLFMTDRPTRLTRWHDR